MKITRDNVESAIGPALKQLELIDVNLLTAVLIGNLKPEVLEQVSSNMKDFLYGLNGGLRETS